jgi:endonuclease/exonuclease/phosphatase family metal-dependent hydrolase
MTFNIQHGIDGTNRYNLQRAIDTIARVQPDIVGWQDVTPRSLAPSRPITSRLSPRSLFARSPSE